MWLVVSTRWMRAFILHLERSANSIVASSSHCTTNFVGIPQACIAQQADNRKLGKPL